MSVSAYLTLTSDQAQVEAGGSALLTASITNAGAQAAEFSLLPRGIEPAWLTFRPPTVTVEPGQQATASIFVNPPAGVVSAELLITIMLVAKPGDVYITEASVPLRLLGAALPTAPPQPTPQAKKSGGRGIWVVAGVVGLLLIAALVGVLIHNQGGASSTPTPAALMGAPCADPPTKLATLFSDNSLTAIRLSDVDTTNLQVLHTEPANILPGLFEPLLALSGDNSRLAYVTASNESMDDAHLWYLDVANPTQATELAAIPQGFWNVRPAWSPDNKQIAYLRLNVPSAAQGKTELELWVAEVGGQAKKVDLPTDLLRPDDFTTNQALPLCWAADNKTVIFKNVTRATNPADQGTRYTGSSSAGTQAGGQQATSTTAATDTLAGSNQVEVDVTSGARRDAVRPDQPLPPVAADVVPPAPPAQPQGTQCALVAFSQNDPRWSKDIMHTGGDRIGPMGCALTSAAMVLNFYGADTNPGTLNACLGSAAEDIYWSQAVGCVKGKVTGANALGFTWPNLDQILASGKPAIVGLLGGQAGSHFVVVTSGGGGDASNYTITDPWDASTNHTLQTLIGRGYNPYWIRTYDGADQGCMRVVSAPAPAEDGSGVATNNNGRPLAPSELMDFFTHAASQTGVPREYLLAIASIESSFTPRAQGPLIPQFANNEDAHALGMMQFLPSTYRGLMDRVDKATGKNLGKEGIWDPESAIFAAAFYLRDAGAPGNMHDAIFSYNHAEWYVAKVVALAKQYAGGVILDDNLFDANSSNKPGTLSNPNPPGSPDGTTTGTPAASAPAPDCRASATCAGGLTLAPTPSATVPTGTTSPILTVPASSRAPKPPKLPTVKGGKPAPKPHFIWSVPEGSVHRGAVQLNLSWFGDIGEVLSAKVLNLTLSSKSVGPVPSQDFTQGMTLTDEGIYQAVIVTLQDGEIHVTRRKFTIDHTAPLLNVTLANDVQTSATTGAVPLGLSLAPRTVAADPKPASRGPAMLDVRYSDVLSGVATIEYQLDGSAWKLLFNDAQFNGAMKVAAPGDHLIALRATDLAGNISDVRTFDFTVMSETAQPATATPVPTKPAATPTALATATATTQPSATPSPTEAAAPDATQTPVPTRPPAATNAPPPPTDTPVPTDVPTPTLVPTASNSAAILVLPPDQTVNANAPGGANVSFNVSAHDNAGNTVPVTCNWASGALFPVGVTVVSCTATTPTGQSSTGQFRVTVKASQPPIVNAANQTVEGNTNGGANVTLAVSAQDPIDGPLPASSISCNPQSGSYFPLGPTTVTCTATNSAGLRGSKQFIVTVRDTTAPKITPQADITTLTTDSDHTGAYVKYGPTATDIVDGTVPVTCNPTVNYFFPVGTTPVTCMATDSSGNTATITFKVIVNPPPVPPGKLNVIPASGTLYPGSSFTIQNTGGQSLTWSASVNSPWYRLSQYSGTLAPGAQVSVTVTDVPASRSMPTPSPGVPDGTISISGNGGSFRLGCTYNNVIF